MVEVRIHDWLKTSCRNGLQVQVLLRVIYACVVQLEDTADLGSVALWHEGSRPFAGNMLQWCKWKTRLAKAQMPYGMRVRFSPEADTYKWRNWDTRLPQKQLPFWSKGSKPFLYIMGY